MKIRNPFAAAAMPPAVQRAGPARRIIQEGQGPVGMLQFRFNAAANEARQAAQEARQRAVQRTLNLRADTDRRAIRMPMRDEARRELMPELNQALRQQRVARVRARRQVAASRIRVPRTPRFGGRPGTRRLSLPRRSRRLMNRRG